MASDYASPQHRALDEPFRIERLRNIQQYLVDHGHGVNQQSARHMLLECLDHSVINTFFLSDVCQSLLYVARYAASVLCPL